MVDDWPCPAYGPDGREIGGMCFFAPPHLRVCGSEPECHRRLAAERTRLFAAIQEMAAAGDPVGAHLAAAFTDPDQLLGGGDPDVLVTSGGVVLTESDIYELAQEAEEGYDPDKLVPRRTDREKPPEQDK